MHTLCVNALEQHLVYFNIFLFSDDEEQKELKIKTNKLIAVK